jgi:hypothetical protein
VQFGKKHARVSFSKIIKKLTSVFLDQELFPNRAANLLLVVIIVVIRAGGAEIYHAANANDQNFSDLSFIIFSIVVNTITII